jgi:hypothetical protein
MKNDISERKPNFFHRLSGSGSKIKIAVVAILFFIIFGLIIDTFSGFYILRNAKSLLWGIIGLIVLAIFYLIGEAGSEWIESKDDISHPLYKRAFHLLVLLCFAGALFAVCL